MVIVIPSLVKGQALQNLPREEASLPLSSWLISFYYHTPLCFTCCWAIVGSYRTSRFVVSSVIPRMATVISTDRFGTTNPGPLQLSPDDV